MKTKRTTALALVALTGLACATAPIAKTGQPPNRGSETNRVDVVLVMKKGTCQFNATPTKVWANKGTKDKVKWDVTNYCSAGVVSLKFAESPFESGCQLTTGQLGTNGGHDSFKCTLNSMTSDGTHSYDVYLGATKLDADPDVEVWN